METIQLIVTALVAGATATLQGTAGQAVKDAYAGLKFLIIHKYPEVGVDRLEAKPESGPRKEAVMEDLEETEAASDVALLQQAKALLDALKEELAVAPNKIMSVDLANIEAAALDLSNIVAQGDGNSDVTSVKVTDAKIEGELKISGVRANATPTPLPTKSSDSSHSSASPSLPSPIKILFLAANPSGTTRLRIDEELRSVDQALRSSELRERFDLINHGAVRIDDLQPLLLRHKPHIVHFSGHGEEESIILQDANGQIAPVGREALAKLFATLKDNLRCVVLNACYSEPQARAINQYIDVVVGISSSILDSSAHHFAQSFYEGLGYGRSLQTAFDLGSNKIHLQNLGEEYKPQLLHATSFDPATLYLTRTEATDPNT